MNEFQTEIIGQEEIEKELRAAEANNREANFRHKTIQEVNLSERTINCALSFEGAKILGSVYFGKSIIGGNVNFKGATINNTLYLGEALIKGELNCQDVSVGKVMNIIGAIIERNLNLSKAKIKGFLGFNKIEVRGEIIASYLKVEDLKIQWAPLKEIFTFKMLK